MPGASGTSTLLRNALFSNVTTNLSGAGCTVRAEQITSDGASYFKSDLGSCYLTNSLLVGVTTPGTFTSSQTVQTLSSGVGVFRTVGAGAHYLADDTYRNQGIPGVSIAGELKRLTTYPPVVISSDFTSPTVLAPQAQRDTDVGDLGFHYYPVDFAWSGLNLTSSLILTNGVVVMNYGGAGTLIGDQALFISEGRPEPLMNHLIRFNAVQENSLNWGGGTSGSGALLMQNTIPFYAAPTIKLRFTEVTSMGSANAWVDPLFVGGPYTVNFTVQDSLLRGVAYSTWNSTLSATPNHFFTNNILLRPNIVFEQGYVGTGWPMNVRLWNNLVQGGTFGFIYYSAAYGVFDVQNNLFDTVALTSSGTYTVDYNGFKSTTALGGTHNKTVTTADYQTGPLGGFYYPPSGSGNLSTLINAGSVANASTIGFYHKTVLTDQTKEGTSGLDIGFHYVATAGSGATAPLDTNGDTLADYRQDVNGNGTVDGTETSWNTGYTSPNGVPSATSFSLFTPVR